MFVKRKKYLVVLVLAVGFFLRLLGAFNTPLLVDEVDHFQVAKTISVQKENINLPLGDEITEHPLLSVYLLKLGLVLFGDGPLSGRFLFIICNMCCLLMVYMLCKRFLNPEVAMLTLILLAVSQYHVSVSFLTLETSLEFLFIPIAIYFFCGAVEERKPSNFIILGIILGLGYLAKETMSVFIPIFLLFLLTDRKRRGLLCCWQLYVGFLLFVLLISPSLYWNMNNGFVNFKSHLSLIANISPSITGLSLYIGEGVRFFGEEAVMAPLYSNEYYFMNWLMGAIALIGVGYNILTYKHDRPLLIKLSLCVFICLTILLCVIRIKNDLFLDNSWWSQIGFIPGIICVSYMFEKLFDKYHFMKCGFVFLVIYLGINSFVMVSGRF